jgi:hypothetical protein
MKIVWKVLHVLFHGEWGGGGIASYGGMKGSKPLNRAFGPVQSFEINACVGHLQCPGLL